MILNNEFRVALPADQAWALLTDLPSIAPCLPGAQLTSVDGAFHRGTVLVKVGPIVTEYAGTARLHSADDTTHDAVILAQGTERRGGGMASATIRARLRTDDGSETAETVVQVHTDLRIAGKIAQFGASAIQQISATMMDQFAANLEAKLAAETSASTEASRAAAGSAVGSAATLTTSEPLSLVAVVLRLLWRQLRRLSR